MSNSAKLRPIRIPTNAATARAHEREKAEQRAHAEELRREKIKKAYQQVRECFTREEYTGLQLRPIIARLYARDLALRANLYAWSDRVQHSHKAAQQLIEVEKFAKPLGMSLPDWARMKERTEAIFEEIRPTITSRLHLACKAIIKRHYADDIELRAWALAGQVAMKAEQRIVDYYTHIAEQRLGVKTRAQLAGSTEALWEVLTCFAGAEMETGDLDSYVNEITNFILSINLFRDTTKMID